MINPDSVNSLAAAVLPARGDSGNGEQKRAAWMLQMERALLAANQVKVTPESAQTQAPAGMAGATPASGKAAESNAPREKNREDSNASAVAATGGVPVASRAQAAAREPDSSASQADAAPGIRASQAASVSASGGASNATAQPMQSAQSAQLAQSAQTGAQAGDGAGIANDGTMPGTGAQAGATGSAFQNGLQLTAATQPLPESAMTALAAGLLPVLNPYQNLQADGQSAAVNLSVAAVRAASPVGLWALTQANSQGKPLAAQAGDAEVAETPAAGFEAPDTEPFTQRQLHLYQGADGVQAWIRDADLNQMRAQLVAQALNNELNAAGLKLKTLTVNGRKLDSGSIGAGGTAEDGADALAEFAKPEISANRAVQT